MTSTKALHAGAAGAITTVLMMLAARYGLAEAPTEAEFLGAMEIIAGAIVGGVVPAVWTWLAPRNAIKMMLPLLAVLLVTACGGPVTSTLAKGVDEACAQFNANPLTALPLRKQTVGAINALTTNGNYTAADCDLNGEPDFDIDANGQPLPDVP